MTVGEDIQKGFRAAIKARITLDGVVYQVATSQAVETLVPEQWSAMIERVSMSVRGKYRLGRDGWADLSGTEIRLSVDSRFAAIRQEFHSAETREVALQLSAGESDSFAMRSKTPISLGTYSVLDLRVDGSEIILTLGHSMGFQKRLATARYHGLGIAFSVPGDAYASVDVAGLPSASTLWAGAWVKPDAGHDSQNVMEGLSQFGGSNWKLLLSGSPVGSAVRYNVVVRLGSGEQLNVVTAADIDVLPGVWSHVALSIRDEVLTAFVNGAPSGFSVEGELNTGLDDTIRVGQDFKGSLAHVGKTVSTDFDHTLSRPLGHGDSALGEMTFYYPGGPSILAPDTGLLDLGPNQIAGVATGPLSFAETGTGDPEIHGTTIPAVRGWVAEIPGQRLGSRSYQFADQGTISRLYVKGTAPRKYLWQRISSSDPLVFVGYTIGDGSKGTGVLRSGDGTSLAVLERGQRILLRNVSSGGVYAQGTVVAAGHDSVTLEEITSRPQDLGWSAPNFPWTQISIETRGGTSLSNSFIFDEPLKKVTGPVGFFRWAHGGQALQFFDGSNVGIYTLRLDPVGPNYDEAFLVESLQSSVTEIARGWLQEFYHYDATAGRVNIVQDGYDGAELMADVILGSRAVPALLTDLANEAGAGIDPSLTFLPGHAGITPVGLYVTDPETALVDAMANLAVSVGATLYEQSDGSIALYRLALPSGLAPNGLNINRWRRQAIEDAITGISVRYGSPSNRLEVLIGDASGKVASIETAFAELSGARAVGAEALALRDKAQEVIQVWLPLHDYITDPLGAEVEVVNVPELAGRVYVVIGYGVSDLQSNLLLWRVES